MASLSKVLVCGHSFARIMGSNPAMGMDVCVLFCVLQVKVFASGLILVQKSPTECVCVFVCVIKCNSNHLHLQ